MYMGFVSLALQNLKSVHFARTFSILNDEKVMMTTEISGMSIQCEWLSGHLLQMLFFDDLK